MNALSESFVAKDINYNPIYMDALDKAFHEMKDINLRPRYHEWFHGKPLNITGDEVERKVATKIGEHLVTTMAKVGSSHYNMMVAKLRGLDHRLEKSIAAGLIPGYITHGSCRFGQVHGLKNSTHKEVFRFYVANGDISIDPSKGRSYLSLNSSSNEPTYYGLAQILDRAGEVVGINTKRGDNGVLFKTHDIKEAVFQVASISTGMSVDELRELAEGAKKTSSQYIRTPKF